MHLEGCNMCRSSPFPTEAMTVNFLCRTLCAEFQGKFKFVVHTASHSGASNGFVEGKGRSVPVQYDDNPTQIVFDVEKQNPGTLVRICQLHSPPYLPSRYQLRSKYLPFTYMTNHQSTTYLSGGPRIEVRGGQKKIRAKSLIE